MLHIDTDNVKNKETLCIENVLDEDGKEVIRDDGTNVQDLKYTTKAIGFRAMNIGMGEITKKNHEEFYRRFKITDAVCGSSIRNEDGEVFITLDDIKDHIGLRINVSLFTKAKFKSNMKTAALEALERKHQHILEETEQAQ